MSMNKAIALCLCLGSAQAEAHCYSVWSYPWPQKCHNTTLTPHHYYYVEMVLPSQTQVALPPESTPEELRTPEQLQEEIDHDIAVKIHKSDINSLMILHAEEGTNE